MSTIIMDKKEEVIMKLVHFLVTKENYTPIVVNGTKNEIWLENQEGPYKIVRINSNYIHNNEQYSFDLFKIKTIAKQVKKKTLSFKVNILNIDLDLNDGVELVESKNIITIKADNLKELIKNKDLIEAFPTITTDLINKDNNFDLIMNITNDINTKTAKENENYEETFKPKTIIITKIIIAICVIMFVLSFFIPEILQKGFNQATLVKNGEYLRLITCAFLHAGVLHLACNMYSLYIIGHQVESYIGRWKFTLIYIISLISGSLMSIIFSSNPSVGASGAIFGLLGSLLYFGYHYRLYLGSIMKSQLIPIIIFNLALGFIIPNVDNAAHIGGLIGGYFATMALGIKHKSKKSEIINGIIVLTIYLLFIGYVGIFK